MIGGEVEGEEVIEDREMIMILEVSILLILSYIIFLCMYIFTTKCHCPKYCEVWKRHNFIYEPFYYFDC